MIKQIIFVLVLLTTLTAFVYTLRRLISFFRLTKKGFSASETQQRIKLTLQIALSQTKILRKPLTGAIHALVFWGFMVITFGSLEMVIDGISGVERSLSFLGGLYSVFMAAGDVFAYIVFVAIGVFIVRRIFLKIKRFDGVEMTHASHTDALVALFAILFLMISLIGMNISYIASNPSNYLGFYPISSYFSVLLSTYSLQNLHIIYEICWWMHILLIFAFANYLPYSKHFHVFLSIPNVYLSRLQPLGKLDNMPDVEKEVRLMMNPDSASAEVADSEAPPARFGVKDVDDLVWKSYFDSLSCTQCGRCTSVCPANTTGKLLSPRKIMMNIRQRMNEKAPLLLKNGKDFDDGKSLLRHYISEEELWACTTCNACAEECPVNINHPSVIVAMRRYLVMEEASAPTELKMMFTNMENNGAPWQYSNADRLLWVK